ncbi:Vwa8 [Symbiodinium sp. CCMP2592]|nr:Vwa8 [Symbiodinium sp. CCMP2592]
MQRMLAGIGGRAGPTAVGQELVMLTEEQKNEVSEEWYKKAQQMADEAYAHRLGELKMSAHDESEYRRLLQPVEAQISAFRLVLQSHEAKERERSGQKQQTQGQKKLVCGSSGNLLGSELFLNVCELMHVSADKDQPLASAENTAEALGNGVVLLTAGVMATLPERLAKQAARVSGDESANIAKTEEVPKPESPTAAELGLGESSSKDQAVGGEGEPFAEEAGCDASNTSAAEVESAAEKSQASNSVGRPLAGELCSGDGHDGSRSYSEDQATPSEDAALSRAAGAEDHPDQVVQGTSDAEAADAERGTDRPTAEELGLGDDSRSYSQNPASPSEDGAFSRAAGAEDHPHQVVQGASDAEAADAERGTDEVPKLDRPTAEELGLGDDSRSYSEDPSEDGAFSTAAGAEDHSDQAVQGASDAEAADAERATAEELGLGDDSRSYSEDPASASEEAGSEDHPDQAVQGATAAKEAAAHIATDDVSKSDPPTAEQLGLDSPKNSRTLLPFAVDFQDPASSPESKFLPDPASIEIRPDEAVAEFPWGTKPISSDEDIAEYEASYAETEEEGKSSVSAPKSGIAVSEDLAHSHASSDHADQRGPLRASSSESSNKITVSEDSKVIDSSQSRFLQPLEEASVLESGYSGQWSELDAGPRHVSKDLSEDAYSGEWSEEGA